jgi:hypothetical protein
MRARKSLEKGISEVEHPKAIEPKELKIRVEVNLHNN